MSIDADVGVMGAVPSGAKMETGPESIPGYTEVAPIHSSNAFDTFFAQDPNNELVVVKQLSLNGASDEGRPKIDLREHILHERLAGEALLLEELEHPQLPRILTNNTDHTHPYFVMAPVLGLRDLKLFNHVPNPLVASRIVHSVLEPLDYIHGMDIVHRDIKPSNIFARWTGSAVLGDLGIAARREEVGTSFLNGIFSRKTYDAHTGLTDTHDAVGTAEYISPEQASNQGVDVSSDIYSLGVSFFELLYGKRPYEPEDRKNYIDRINAISRRFYEDVDLTVPADRDIPSPLIGVVEKATQRKPADRYQSAKEMQEDLQRAVAETGKFSWAA